MRLHSSHLKLIDFQDLTDFMKLIFLSLTRERLDIGEYSILLIYAKIQIMEKLTAKLVPFNLIVCLFSVYICHLRRDLHTVRRCDICIFARGLKPFKKRGTFHLNFSRLNKYDQYKLRIPLCSQ